MPTPSQSFLPGIDILDFDVMVLGNQVMWYFDLVVVARMYGKFTIDLSRINDELDLKFIGGIVVLHDDFRTVLDASSSITCSYASSIHL
jgi:hypothetical protein